MLSDRKREWVETETQYVNQQVKSNFEHGLKWAIMSTCLRVCWHGERSVKAIINGYLHHITTEMSTFNHSGSNYT